MDLNVDVCSDCTSPCPQWASVNRGVLLCDECASIHRQLGRHVSQVKHLKKSRWRPTQLEMVRYLAAAHVNRYWEHVLYEHMLTGHHLTRSASVKQSATVAKKPKPTDSLHPTKADFIREKYLFMGFFKKPRNVNQEDLDQQLHASVRTDVLEKSLHLLTSGANPNFIHPTKGTSPLHVACYYGRTGQVEVLLAYGADLCIRDSTGKTPIDVAIHRALSEAETTCSIQNISSLTPEQKLRLAWSPLVDLLVNAYYEVTDGLAYFLSRSVPDHKAAALGSSIRTPGHHSLDSSSNLSNTSPPPITPNGHFLIRTSVLQILNERASSSGLDGNHWIHEARRRLTQLSTPAIEDLCIDVYDEAERRLTNTFLENVESSLSLHKINGFAVNGTNQSDLSCLSPKLTKDSCGVNRSLTLYFLPPNTAYSSVRNQARQKLGRLSTVEFHTLVLDVLVEVSAHLVPLFPPFRPSHRILPANQYHPYSTYLPASSSLDEVPVPVPTRLTPLPPPPLTESSLLMSDSPNEPTTSVTAISNRPSSPEPVSKPESSQVTSVNPDNIDVSTVSENGSKGVRCRGTDPVYDQVAGESDALSLLTQSGSTVPLSTLSSCSTVNDPSETISVSTRSSDPTCELNKSSVTSATRTPISLFDLTANGHLSGPQGPDSAITMCQGEVPGSRRVHIPHTSRMMQRRASVPCVRNGVVKFAVDCPLSPILETVNLTGEPLSRGLAFNDAQLTELRDPMVSIDPYCAAAHGEVERLRKENMDLRIKVSELQEAKNAVEQRLRNLEDRIQQVDSVVEALRDEKSALLTALSAGMEVSHSSPSPHKSSTHSPQSSRVTSDVSTASVTQSQPVCFLGDTYEEECNMNYVDRRHETGNYSVGSHCLDSGMLLRQGIILRAVGGSRGGSPASSSPSSQSLSVTSTTVAPNSPLITTRNGCISPGSSQSSINTPGIVRPHPISYVNVPPIPPQRIVTGVSSPSVSSAIEHRALSTATVPISLLNSSAPTTKYTSPNSTGSASPAPPPPAEHSTGKGVENNLSSECCTPVNKPSGRHPQQDLQNYHDQILASISTIPDYDVPPDQMGPPLDSSNVTSRVVLTPCATGANTSVAKFCSPSPDRVVRSVEAIIVRIRELVQLANGKQTGDFARCSLLIQSAAQDILNLFPPAAQCPSRIERALNDLSTASHQLRPHCEFMSRQLKTSRATHCQGNGPTSALPRTLAPEVATLIQHTHQIAKAAKELLSIFQRSS